MAAETSCTCWICTTTALSVLCDGSTNSFSMTKLKPRSYMIVLLVCSIF